MACEIRLHWLVLVVLVVSNVNRFVHGEPQVPCYFIFGDSLVDSGNNNNLNTQAKVNYKPYGIDFPKGPTGRFTNGRTTADFLAERLGFTNLIPPFATAKGSEILSGVNYASGAAGIRDETGKNQGECFSLNKQLEHHDVTISTITKMLGGKDKADQHLNKCLYTITIGNNDYINNYFLPKFYNTSKLYNPTQYAKALVDQYTAQLKTLYNRGARKVTVTGVGLVGCTPFAISYHGTNGSLCVDKMNMAVQHFNGRLKLLIHELNHELKDATFVYENTLKVSLTSSFNPAMMKTNSTAKCCEVGKYGLCIPDKAPCANRNLVLFWDAFHPTEMVNKLQVNRTYSNMDINEMFPMDIQRLIQK